MSQKNKPESLPEKLDEPAPTSPTASAEAVIEAVARGDVVTLRAHPDAEIFPLMGTRDHKKLANDIKTNGLLHPIILHPDGTILDGRNRYQACLQVDVRPTFDVWKGKVGEEEIDFVISQNLHRRHLSTGQRADLANKLAKRKPGRPKQANLPNMTTQPQAAAAVKVSVRSVRMVRKIEEDAPPNISRLFKADRLKLSVAECVAKASEEDKARIAAMTDDDEAVDAAKSLAKQHATIEAKDALIQRLDTFLERWKKAHKEVRSELLRWLEQKGDADVLVDALNMIATTSSADLSNRAEYTN